MPFTTKTIPGSPKKPQVSSTERRLNQSKRRKLLGNLFRIGIFLIVTLGLFGSLTLFGLIAWYSRDLPSPDELMTHPSPQSTKIFDRTGEHLLYEVHGDEKRTLLKAEEIPQSAKDAVILLEDKTFYEHGGLSLRGIIRIAVNPVLCHININRFCSSGGSTITQQLVKNAILSNERTVSRKLKEILLTLEIERRFSKDQILQMYFNEIPYGSMNYGLESAATSYFGKHAKDLSISESATLAALPRAPSAYLNNIEKLKARRDYALSLMKDGGKITAEEYSKALEEKIVISTSGGLRTAPHFVDYVREILEKQFGVKEVEQGGLAVITSLDYDKQLIAEEEVKKGVEKSGPQYKFTNAALVAIDPKTGQLLAMVGSKDFAAKDIDGQFNVATSPSRQPGSSFKPIVYTAAWMKGYTPETVLWDVGTDFPSTPKPYSPKDYDLKERGPVTLRNSLQGSLNIPAVKLLYLVGLDRALELAKDLGYTTLPNAANVGLSLVLGGGSVPLLEHVNAYATLANEGTRHPTSAILSVKRPTGESLYEWTDQPFKVFDENIARTTSDVLSDNNARAYVFGANSALTLGDRPVAAKTGTTNDYVDAWTLGYTPSLSAGVWAGNNDNKPMNKAGGSLAAAPIWNAFMKRALKGTAIEQFVKPEPLLANKPVLTGYRVDVPNNPDGTPGPQPSLTLEDGTTISNYGLCTAALVDKNSGLLATEYTPETSKENKYFCEIHEILQYLNKDDPQGPPPEDPKQDPMYQPFEDSLTKWLTDRKIVVAAPPTESDYMHRPELKPIVSLLFPQVNDMIVSRFVSLTAQASAPRGISRIDYFADKVKLGESRFLPFAWSGNIPNQIAPGLHQIRAVAYDDVDNSSETSVQVNITAPIIPIIVSILKPIDGLRIKASKFPLNFSVSVGPGIQTLDMMFARDGAAQQFYATTPNPTGTATVTWQTAPEKGTYVIQMRGREEGEVYHYSNPITVIVE
ncbi:MAG: transglycosylase domain-containing protein [bacterium]